MSVRRIAPVLPVAFIVLALAGHAIAETATRTAPARPRAARASARPASRAVATAAPKAPATAATRVALPPATAGMVVGIDPETGLLGPATAEQRLQLLPEEEHMLSRSTVGLVERPLSGGGVLLDLDGRFQEFSYVRVTPDGRIVFGCAGDLAALRRGLAAPPRPAAVLEDR